MKLNLKRFAGAYLKRTLLNGMKVLIFLMSTMAFCLSTNDTFAQETIYLEKNQELSIDEVFDILKKQTDYNFVYPRKLFLNSPKIKVEKGETKVSDLLDKILSPNGLDFKITNGHTVLLVKNKEPSNSDKAQQDYEVSGTVSDENGQLLPGANVLEKNTQNGTQTDFDGNFTLSVQDQSAILVVSYIGFETQELPLNGRSEVTIALKEDAASLDEVVVVGYGTATKKDVTGAIASVDMEDANIAANTSVMQAVQGRVPGINIGAVSAAGQTPNLSIRGQNSLSASNAPLVVVDGIIYPGSLNDFSATDIESIDFLKDASAAAVYGSRASNGVVLITTKTGKGESSKPSITFNTYTGIQEAGKLLDVMNGQQYIQKIIDFGQATGQDIDQSNVADFLQDTEIDNYRNGTEIDWADKQLRAGVIQNYELGISGNTGKTKYYMSGTYTGQKGIRIGDDFQRTTVRVNLSNDITDWLTIGINSAYTNSDFSGQAVSFNNSVLLSPYGRIFQADNPEEYEIFPQTDQLISNPFLNLLNDDLDKRDNLFAVFNLDLDLPVKGLTYRFDYSKNLFFDRKARFQSRDRAGIDGNGIATKSNRFRSNWLMNNVLDYSTTINNVHRIGATVVYTRDFEKFDRSDIESTGFDVKSLGYNAVELGEVQTVASEAYDQTNEGFMTRINYAYDNRYLFTGTFRRDGFSGFAENKKFANFFSASLGWVLSEESFMSGLDWLSFLKLRLSYGENGNQALGRYGSLSRIETTQYVFGDGSQTYNGQQISTIANPNLEWETTRSTNLGVNFDLFKGRLTGDLDFYVSKTDNLIVERSLSSYTGFNNVITNLGEINNKGLEIYLNSVNIEKGDFTWETGFTFSLNRNEIVSLYGEDSDGDGIEDDDISQGWFIGESIDAIFDYPLEGGVYQIGDTDIPNRYREGEFRVIDTNEDGEINPDDRVIVGNELPNYRFGITNTLRYKKLSLTAFLNSVQGGNNWYLGDNRALNPDAFFPGRINMVDIPYWTPDNPTNEFPRIDYNPRRDHLFLQDRSFVRLQDVTLSYDLSNNSFLNKLNITKLRIYASGKNLITWSNWIGYDPELASTLGDSPIMRSYIMGVEIGL
ncbi:TonB-dependent receptor [Arenibacter sp. F20364]|uniref:SusC/RagA family TonB-linked outer membrane protein n=1 Tax=Arenibacter sp. F20364 TaxID=2926415 RepID=UPI001FF2D95D|nr:TonB-dependent receptor [Arenibacter sp. F20364]MCK0190692.1 TonB-dependent receptor [Arenibacter sp. F20364]